MGLLKTAGRTMVNLGLDPRRLKHAGQFQRYLRDRRLWKQKGGRIDSTFAVLGDYADSAGSATGHYFHMDLLVARYIAEAQPRRHLDIGSRIDGFVAHVAAFRAIDVMDIRPLSIPAHPQIRFVQGDLMSERTAELPKTDSLSCLHVLEHFGLGRYGDPIDPSGHRRAFDHMVDLLSPGGTFYFASPVGRPQVVFNAHRVFDPLEVPAWAADKLELKRFDHVDDAGDLHLDTSPDAAVDFEFGCGIYTFGRRS